MPAPGLPPAPPLPRCPLHTASAPQQTLAPELMLGFAQSLSDSRTHLPREKPQCRAGRSSRYCRLFYSNKPKCTWNLNKCSGLQKHQGETHAASSSATTRPLPCASCPGPLQSQPVMPPASPCPSRELPAVLQTVAKTPPSGGSAHIPPQTGDLPSVDGAP